MQPTQRAGAEAVAAAVEAFRMELVRRYGEPWYREREALVERLAAALVARTRDHATRVALVQRWCADAFPQLDRWLAHLEAPAPGERRHATRVA